MNTNIPGTDRFEDRLLTAILADFEHLTAPGLSSPRACLHSSSAGRSNPMRRIVPLMIAGAAATTFLVVGVAMTGSHRHGHAVSTIASARPAHTGTVMKLASYHLRVPVSYRLLTAATISICPAMGVGFASPNTSPARTSAHPGTVPGYASEITTAANTAGGCIAMVLAPAYTPTAANPDPESGTLEDSRPVQVGAYQARSGTWNSVAKPSGAITVNQALYVEIPVTNGQQQDLVISATGLSQHALIAIVASGLSVGSSSTTSSSGGTARAARY